MVNSQQYIKRTSIRLRVVGNICYNNVMNRVVNFLQKYFAVISVLIGISILLSVTFSSYIVTSNNHKAAEMYIGELKYSMEIDGSTTNTLTVPTGETIVDVKVNNLNPVDTYYKLLYLKNTNITVKYYESTKDTYDVVTTYNKPNDSITSSNSNTIKLLITNNSTSSQNIALTMKGGYITNTVQDITTPSTYSEITLVETPSTNTYFCTTTDTLTQGLKYVNGQYTYAYKQQGDYSSSGLGWYNTLYNGWGIQLTDKASTDSVTSRVCTYINNKPITSMSYIFRSSHATTIDLSNINTSNVTNMYKMFADSKATTLDLSSFDTSKVTNMSEMFASSQATTLDLSSFDTSKVTDMSGMFSASQVATLNLSHFDTSNVANMSNMFSGSQVTTLDLSTFDTSKVTNMSSMFSNSQATTIDVSNFDISKVTNMDHMFYYSQATTIDVSNFNTSNVRNMGYMFSGSQATTLDVSHFDTSNVTNMQNMFMSSQATTIDVSNFDTSKVTIMAYMFTTSQATTIDVSNFDTSSVTDMQLMFANSKATTLNLNNFDTSNVTNMGSMFMGSQATEIKGLENFNTSNVTDMNNMFSGSQATTLDVSHFDTSNVTNMVSMFFQTQVTTLDLSHFDTSKVTNMKWMFRSSRVTTLDLSSFDTSNVTDMSMMFHYSTKLTTIYASNKFNTDNVTNSSDMFTYTANLVGGTGTKYNSSYVDKTYAHIDGGTSNPGYFTDIADKPSEPNLFATDSWPTIINAVKNNNIGKYNVGDTKTINMGTYGTHTIRIANTSTPSECSTAGFSQTACGFVLEFTDIITARNMNPAGTYNGTQYNSGHNIGGWPASSMRTFVNNDIYNLLSTDLKNGIINTTVISSHGKSDTSNFTSTDKLYLLAPKEIYSDFNDSYDTAKDLTRQLDYYKNEGVTTSSYSKTIKIYNSRALFWWLRSAGSRYDDIFLSVSDEGNWYHGIAGFTYGVSPAFRIG